MDDLVNVYMQEVATRRCERYLVTSQADIRDTCTSWWSQLKTAPHPFRALEWTYHLRQINIEIVFEKVSKRLEFTIRF